MSYIVSHIRLNKYRIEKACDMYTFFCTKEFLQKYILLVTFFEDCNKNHFKTPVKN